MGRGDLDRPGFTLRNEFDKTSYRPSREPITERRLAVLPQEPHNARPAISKRNQLNPSLRSAPTHELTNKSPV